MRHGIRFFELLFLRQSPESSLISAKLLDVILASFFHVLNSVSEQDDFSLELGSRCQRDRSLPMRSSIALDCRNADTLLFREFRQIEVRIVLRFFVGENDKSLFF